MALDTFLSTASSQTEEAVSQTPEAKQQQTVIQARTEVTQDNAGQSPPTGNTKTLLPYVKGGLGLWVLIVVMLWIAFGLYNRSQGHEAVKIKQVVEETVEEGEGE